MDGQMKDFEISTIDDHDSKNDVNTYNTFKNVLGSLLKYILCTFVKQQALPLFCLGFA